MSELTKLVPPLELCKKIPAGEFDESTFIWMEVEASATMTKTWSLMQGTPYARQRPNRQIPAPTLQEIMEVLLQGVELDKDSGYFCSLSMSNEYYGETAVIAALKVWLKLKGIEYAE